MKYAILIIICAIHFELSAQIPQWQWAHNIYGKTTYGNSQDLIKSVATDAWGNVFVCGNTSSKILILGKDTLKNDTIKNAAWDIFLLKYNKNGELLWSYSIKGEENEWCNDIAIDAKGNVYLIGGFRSKSLNFGKNILTNGSEFYSMFLAKFDNNGNVLWAKQSIGKNNKNDDIGEALTIDKFGNIYSIVSFESSTIDLGAGEIKNKGSRDAVIIKYNTNGNIIWTKNISSEEFDDFKDIAAVDESCNILILGLGKRFGDFNLTSNGESDIVIAKLNRNGDNIWVKNIGGKLYDYASAICVDFLGNFYISGFCYHNNYNLDFGNVKLFNNSYGNSFIAKFDPEGRAEWVRDFSTGGESYNNTNSIATDGKGNILFTSSFHNPLNKFDSLDITNAADFGQGNILLFKLTDKGKAIWAKSIRGDKYLIPTSVFVDGADNIILSGIHTAAQISFDNLSLKSPVDENTMTNTFISKLGKSDYYKDVENLIIYPNPSNGSFCIKNIIEQTQLVIYDIQGKYIYSNNGDNTNIDIRGVKPGIYILKLLNERLVTYHKIIIQ